MRPCRCRRQLARTSPPGPLSNIEIIEADGLLCVQQAGAWTHLQQRLEPRDFGGGQGAGREVRRDAVLPRGLGHAVQRPAALARYRAACVLRIDRSS